MENPYRTLGLSPGASAAEIRAAYRSLAFRYHPDVNPEDTSAERRFREVRHAYELISDPGNRESKTKAACEGEMERVLRRLKASLASASEESRLGVSLGKSCRRERTTRHEKPFFPPGDFVRPIPPLPPKAPRSPLPL